MSKKIPLNGEPNFTNVSDEKLREYIDFVQQMIFVYKYSDKDKSDLLSEVWKDLSNEQTERMGKSVEEALSHEEVVKIPAVHKIKTVKRIKR